MWTSIKDSLKAVGDFQSRLILTLFYIFVCPLFALIARFKGDELGLAEFTSGKSSSWKSRSAADRDIEAARKQS